MRAAQEPKPMASYKQRIATVPPPTLQKQLEVLQAARALFGQDNEAARRRREEIAALRREHGELVELAQELWRQYDPRLRSHVIRDDSAHPAFLRASPDDPEHPGWPAGTPDGRGGKFRPKDGDEGAAGAQLSGDVIHVCVLMPDMSSGGTCMYWCHGGFLLEKQRNLGFACPSLVREPG
jgi:hypothetical protein